MADGDGVGRPVGLTLWTAGDEAEIDQGYVSVVELGDNIGPNAGMKAPAMDENEMHDAESDGTGLAWRGLRWRKTKVRSGACAGLNPGSSTPGRGRKATDWS